MGSLTADTKDGPRSVQLSFPEPHPAKRPPRGTRLCANQIEWVRVDETTNLYPSSVSDGIDMVLLHT